MLGNTTFGQMVRTHQRHTLRRASLTSDLSRVRLVSVRAVRRQGFGKALRRQATDTGAKCAPIIRNRRAQ